MEAPCGRGEGLMLSGLPMFAGVAVLPRGPRRCSPTASRSSPCCPAGSTANDRPFHHQSHRRRGGRLQSGRRSPAPARCTGLSLLAAVAITGGTRLARPLRGADLLVAGGWHFLLGAPARGLASLAKGPPTGSWTPRFMSVLTCSSPKGDKPPRSSPGSPRPSAAVSTSSPRGPSRSQSSASCSPRSSSASDPPDGPTLAGLSVVLVSLGIALRPDQAFRRPAALRGPMPAPEPPVSEQAPRRRPAALAPAIRARSVANQRTGASPRPQRMPP